MTDGIKSKAIERTLNNASNNVLSFKHLESFVDLSNSDQREILNIISLAFKNVIKNTILSKGELTLPYIGIIKIKTNNKFAIKNKEIVANELGYNEFILIPKDKLDFANQRVRELTSADIIKDKQKGKRKRKSHQELPKTQVKVLQFIR